MPAPTASAEEFIQRFQGWEGNIGKRHECVMDDCANVVCWPFAVCAVHVEKSGDIWREWREENERRASLG